MTDESYPYFTKGLQRVGHNWVTEQWQIPISQMKNETGEVKCYTVGVVRPEYLCRSVWLKKNALFIN